MSIQVGLPCVYQQGCSAISWLLLFLLIGLVTALALAIIRERRKARRKHRIKPPRK